MLQDPGEVVFIIDVLLHKALYQLFFGLVVSGFGFRTLIRDGLGGGDQIFLFGALGQLAIEQTHKLGADGIPGDHLLRQIIVISQHIKTDDVFQICAAGNGVQQRREVVCALCQEGIGDEERSDVAGFRGVIRHKAVFKLGENLRVSLYKGCCRYAIDEQVVFGIEDLEGSPVEEIPALEGQGRIQDIVHYLPVFGIAEAVKIGVVALGASRLQVQSGKVVGGIFIGVNLIQSLSSLQAEERVNSFKHTAQIL